MLQQFRSGAHQVAIANPFDLNHIISNQAITAFDNFQGGFAFTNATRPGNQYTDPKNLNQDPMQTDPGCRQLIDIIDQIIKQAGGMFLAF